MDTTDIVYNSDDDAIAVLTAMKQLLDQYEVVTFGDMLQLSGISSLFKDQKVGWENLDGVAVKEVERGYILELPPTKSLV